MSSVVITLTTDFGLKDPYQGAMKGVMLSINPDVRVVDISHLVSFGNVLEGAFVLLQAYSFFPSGTIHVGVVDPGVGGRRRPILVETERHYFIGPDNGLFTFVMEREETRRIVHLTRSDYFLEDISSTFHGRDVFAPVAARLSLGLDAGEFGERIFDPFKLEVPRPEREAEGLLGEVIYADAFGNLITNIGGEDIKALCKGGGEGVEPEFTIRGLSTRGVRRSYVEGEGEPFVALVGSSGNIEIASFKRSAREELGAGTGEEVRVRLKK